MTLVHRAVYNVLNTLADNFHDMGQDEWAVNYAPEITDEAHRQSAWFEATELLLEAAALIRSGATDRLITILRHRWAIEVSPHMDMYDEVMQIVLSDHYNTEEELRDHIARYRSEPDPTGVQPL